MSSKVIIIQTLEVVLLYGVHVKATRAHHLVLVLPNLTYHVVVVL